jgi:protoheme IX farnesyltransferase
MRKLKDYLEVFKFKQTLLLLLTGICSFIGGSRVASKPFSASTLLAVALSMFLTISGTTGINMVLDADIDAVMFRTRNRPIPANRLSKRETATASIVLLVLGLMVCLLVNLYVAVAGLLGFLIDIAVYTWLLKRRSPWSVVFGGFAGGMPALGGWAGATGSFGLGGLMLMLLVAVWSSLHIWTLSTYYIDDYRKANVPMLPAVYGEEAGVKASLIVSLIVLTISAMILSLGLIPLYGFIAAITPLLAAIVILASSLKRGDYREGSFKAFKMVNVFTGLFFLLLMLP